MKVFLRTLLLKLANGIEKEKFKHCKGSLKDFEKGYEALKIENRQLKTKIKEIKLKVNNPKLNSVGWHRE